MLGAFTVHIKGINSKWHHEKHVNNVCLLCCFTSHTTAMVMAGQSVHLTTLFPWQA